MHAVTPGCQASVEGGGALRAAGPPAIAAASVRPVARPLARWRASRARATLAPMDARLPEIARSTAAARGMLPDDSVVLAMVSGGADSVALLRLLASGELAPARAVSVLHVDHMLRGGDSDGDAAFVAGLCTALGVSCTVARYDVAAYAEEAGLNLEDAGAVSATGSPRRNSTRGATRLAPNGATAASSPRTRTTTAWRPS
jgi:hypothetical protein